MASTNKTTNILLSQFLGTDHFSFLTDYNRDMLKIDTYCGNLKAMIDSATSQLETLNQFKSSQTQTNLDVDQAMHELNRQVVSANNNSTEAMIAVDAMQTRVSTLEVNNDKASNTMKQYAYEATRYNDLSGSTKNYILPKMYIKDTTGVMNVEMYNGATPFSTLTTILGTDFTQLGSYHYIELNMADYNDNSWKKWITAELKNMVGTFQIGEITYTQVVDIDGTATAFLCSCAIVMTLGENKATIRIYNTDSLLQFGAKSRNVTITGGTAIQI